MIMFILIFIGKKVTKNVTMSEFLQEKFKRKTSIKRPFHTGTQCALNAHSMRIGRFHIQCTLEPMRIQSGLNPLPRNPLPEVV